MEEKTKRINRTSQKHISVQMSSPFYSYNETGDTKYVTIQYWNSGIYLSFISKTTDQNIDEISFRMPEHVIRAFSETLKNIMMSRVSNYTKGIDYDDVHETFYIGKFVDDKTVLDGTVEIYTTSVRGSKRIVLEARRDNISIPIVFYSDYVITDVSPQNEEKLKGIDIYDTKIFSFYQSIECSGTTLYRVIYNTAEQTIRAFSALLDEKLGISRNNYSKSNYGSRGDFSTKSYSRESNKPPVDESDELPF